MGKKNKKCTVIKISSSVICPKCGEKYSHYTSKKGKQKGISSGEFYHEGFINNYHIYSYVCYTCGYHWSIRNRL